MKRLISIITVIAILVGMMTFFRIPITALGAARNLFTDGGFETNESMSTGSSWTFKSGLNMYYRIFN